MKDTEQKPTEVSTRKMTGKLPPTAPLPIAIDVMSKRSVSSKSRKPQKSQQQDQQREPPAKADNDAQENKLYKPPIDTLLFVNQSTRTVRQRPNSKESKKQPRGSSKTSAGSKEKGDASSKLIEETEQERIMYLNSLVCDARKRRQKRLGGGLGSGLARMRPATNNSRESRESRDESFATKRSGVYSIRTSTAKSRSQSDGKKYDDTGKHNKKGSKSGKEDQLEIAGCDADGNLFSALAAQAQDSIGACSIGVCDDDYEEEYKQMMVVRAVSSLSGSDRGGPVGCTM